jgi:hypothetical protein
VLASVAPFLGEAGYLVSGSASCAHGHAQKPTSPSVTLLTPDYFPRKTPDDVLEPKSPDTVEPLSLGSALCSFL